MSLSPDRASSKRSLNFARSRGTLECGHRVVLTPWQIAQIERGYQVRDSCRHLRCGVQLVVVGPAFSRPTLARSGA